MSEPSPENEGPAAGWKIAVALVWLIGFSVYFYTRPMPNLAPTTRPQVWEQVPERLLDLVLPPPANEDAPPSGWQYLPQRFPLWGIAALVMAGACSLGRLALRALGALDELKPAERHALGCGLGLAAVSLFTLACGLMGVFSRVVHGCVLGVAILAEVVCCLRSRATPPETVERRTRVGQLLVAAMVPFLWVMLLGGVSPSTDFDVKEYHLQGPKEFFQDGRIHMLEHNVYTSFPFLTEMLTLTGMVLHGDWFLGALAGKCVLMMFGPLTALAVFAAGRRWFGTRAGIVAALTAISIPWTTRISIIAYAEGGLSFYLVASVLAVGIAVERRRISLFFVAGCLAGSAMACKYTGLVSAVAPLFVAVCVTVFRRGRSSEDAIHRGAIVSYVLGVAVAIGPWLLKNTVETGNPVYPLAWSIFDGRDWNQELNAKWTAAHSPNNHDLTELVWMSGQGRPGWIIDVMAINDWLSALLYGFAPLALLAASGRHPAGRLWLMIAWLFFSWWAFTHRLDRFWVPMLPIVAVAAGAGFVWCGNVVWKFAAGTALVAGLLFNFVICANATGYNVWLTDLDYARQHTASITRPANVMLNREFQTGRLPSDTKMLFVGEAEVFDVEFPVLYNTAFDVSRFESICRDASSAEAKLKDAAEIKEALRAAGVTHVYVNWREILRYRQTYGYTDFAHPKNFDALVKDGVLELPRNLATVRWETLSYKEADDISAEQRRVIEGQHRAMEESGWVPFLTTTQERNGQPAEVWIPFQLYRVRSP